MNIISSFRLGSKNLCVLFVLSFSLLFACAPERAQVNLIPQPVSIKQGKGYFKVDSLKVVKEGIESYIHSTIDSSLNEIGTEGYLLSVTPERIELSATTPTGIYYGKKTIYQLLTSQQALEGIAVQSKVTRSQILMYRGISFPKRKSLNCWMKCLTIK